MSTNNDLDSPTGNREGKQFETLAAMFALKGFALYKGDPAIEGQPPFMAMRWGIGAQAFGDIDDARSFLARIERAPQ